MTLDDAHVLCMLTLHGTESILELKNLKEAQAQQEWQEWSRAMDTKFAQLRQLKTFEIADLPAGQQPIGCRWVYQLKRDSKGRIVRYTAGLVAQGFSQVPGLDYFKTFAPVIRTDLLQMILAIVAERGWCYDNLMLLTPTSTLISTKRFICVNLQGMTMAQGRCFDFSRHFTGSRRVVASGITISIASWLRNLLFRDSIPRLAHTSRTVIKVSCSLEYTSTT